MLPVLIAALLMARPPSCGLDAHEPNDVPKRARRLDARPIEGVVCPGDVDWFRVRLRAGTEAEIAVRGGPLLDEPEVVAPRRRARIRSWRSADEVGVRFVAHRDGIYRVRLRGGEARGTRWRMRLWLGDP